MTKLVPKGLQVEIAVAKIAKVLVGESGDTVEMIERPHGGLSLVLVDGQRSGRAAKLISNIAARKIVSLLADGVRDGAAARAAHDYLRTIRQGQVSAEVSILSLDLVSGTLVLSRNTRCPAVLARRGEDSFEIQVIADQSQPIGIHAGIKPTIREITMEAGLYLILFTDGVTAAGFRHGAACDAAGFVRACLKERPISASQLAEALLSYCVELDRDRPEDDISIVVLAICEDMHDDRTRRMLVTLPI